MEENNQSIRLNKYIAQTGLCSRREADKLIESGSIKVNGKIITQLGSKILPGDQVHCGTQALRSEKHVYLLLNKPKDYITTSDDPEGRRTVMELVKGACRERIYPVGRLDRSTTGLLFFTNDGALAKNLSHPRHGVRKIYHAELDKTLRQEDFEKILGGVILEDGKAEVDELFYVEGENKKIGITLHVGKNRIVRRIFESLDYRVTRLDRVNYAGLTKKDLLRGRWRMLTEKEVGFLKMIAGKENKSNPAIKPKPKSRHTWNHSKTAEAHFNPEKSKKPLRHWQKGAFTRRKKPD